MVLDIPMIVAAIQTDAGGDIKTNLERALGLIDKAADKGAKLVCLPEYFLSYGAEETWVDVAKQGAKTLDVLSKKAAEHKIYLLAGSILFPGSSDKKVVNESVLLDPAGGEIARYRKTHLFDVETSDRRYAESDFLEAGDKMVTADIDNWRVGLSICFDLRFPNHYQELKSMGATIMTAPSAFSRETGRDHFETLVRCRAIETQSYVIAPALMGKSPDGKRLNGHSLIADPWGAVIASRTVGQGALIASIDAEFLGDIRKRMPL